MNVFKHVVVPISIFSAILMYIAAIIGIWDSSTATIAGKLFLTGLITLPWSFLGWFICITMDLDI